MLAFDNLPEHFPPRSPRFQEIGHRVNEAREATLNVALRRSKNL